ncbi:hypothetical protein AB0M97_10295 [Streptomyces sp. NPDC051207]|uniref:hypothetical protein n=1 Tax=Streptomyces sp. NPDC051207 TaxID=3154641 RepID=UPI00344022D6
MTGDSAPPSPSALLLAAIRAAGSVAAPRSAALLKETADAAQRAGRTVLQLRAAGESMMTLRLGWPAGSAPDIEQLGEQAPAALARIPTLVWALCLKAAWPDPTLPHYPGQPFSAQLIETASAHLGADSKSVSTALERLLPGHGLIVAVGPMLYLGPAVATLPGPTIAALRRGHHRLPDPYQQHTVHSSPHPPQAHAGDPDTATSPHELTPPDDAQHSSEHISRSIITALETARGPLPPRDLPALNDLDIRAHVQAALADIGRMLIRTPQGTWTTGYPDPVAEALAAAGIGTLSPAERTVLALVLLHTVALPRAQGRHTHPQWNATQHSVTLRELARNRTLTKTTIREALRTLTAAGMVDTAGQGNYVPGPCLQRLSEPSIAALWEDLILAGRPDGHLARAIARRRQAARPTAPSQEHT